MPKRSGEYVKEVEHRLTWLNEIGDATLGDMVDSFGISRESVKTWADHMTREKVLIFDGSKYKLSQSVRL